MENVQNHAVKLSENSRDTCGHSHANPFKPALIMLGIAGLFAIGHMFDQANTGSFSNPTPQQKTAPVAKDTLKLKP